MIRIFAFLIGLASLTPSWGAQVVLRETAEVGSGIVRLRDIAEVTGVDAELLERVPMMPAPPAGASRQLSAGAIRDMLRAQGVELASVTFRGAFQVNVTGETTRPAVTTPAARQVLSTPVPSAPTRTGFRVRTGARSFAASPLDLPARRRAVSSVSAVEQRITETLQSLLDTRSTDIAEPNRLAVKSIEMTQTAADELRTFDTTQLRAQFNDAGPDGPGRFGGTAWPESRGIDGAFRVVAEIIELPTRVVATQPIARKSTITRSALRLEVVPLAELDRPSAAGFSKFDEAVGKEAIRPIRANEVLSDLNTAPPLLVRKGDLVSVVANGGGISVTLNAAVALGDGRLRDTVEVEAYDGVERFRARVIGDRQLALIVAGPETNGALRVGGIQ